MGKTNLTPHAGGAEVIRHKLAPTIHYKNTFKTESITSLSAENVWRKECTKNTPPNPENSYFCNKLVLESYHTDKDDPASAHRFTANIWYL